MFFFRCGFMDGLGLPEGRSYVSSCKRTYKVAPGTTSCKWGYIWCPYKWPKIHGYLTVVFSPFFVWRTFEKKGPSLPRSSSLALVLEGVTLDPPQQKAQPGLAPSHKGMSARLGKPIDVTFPSRTLIHMRCFLFYILP